MRPNQLNGRYSPSPNQLGLLDAGERKDLVHQ
jgi:hypothetical protein